MIKTRSPLHSYFSKNNPAKKEVIDKETSLFFPCIRVRRSKKNQIVTGLLVLALFLERYCFIVTVYKTKYYGYILIMFVILLNAIFNGLIARLRRKKTTNTKRLHEIFNLERAPKVGYCVIAFVG